MKKVLLVFLTLFTTCSVHAQEIVFQDSFSRADSSNLGVPDIGGSWFEQNESLTSDALTIRKAYINLSDEKLDLVYDEGLVSAPMKHTYAYANLTKSTILPTKVSFKFAPHETARVHYEVALMNSDKGYYNSPDGSGLALFLPVDGISIEIVRTNVDFSNSQVSFVSYNNGVRVVHRPTNRMLPFQFMPGVFYEVDFEIKPNGLLTAKISQGTISATVDYQVSPFDLTNRNFNRISLTDTQGAAYTTNVNHTYFDDFKVVSVDSQEPPQNKYPLYSQTNSPYPSLLQTAQWADEQYANGSADYIGSCGNTISQCGCAITSLVMIARHNGIETDVAGGDVNPKNFNNWLEANGGYDGTGSIKWTKALGYFGTRNASGKIETPLSFAKHNEKNIDAMKAAVESNNLGVIGFNNNAGHYLVLSDVIVDSFGVQDPFWYETKTTDDINDRLNNVRDYNNTIDKANFIAFGEAKVAKKIIDITLASPAELLLENAAGQKTGYLSEATVTEITSSSYDREEFIARSGQAETMSDIHYTKRLMVLESDGQYTLAVKGTGTGSYNLSISVKNAEGTDVDFSVTAGTTPNAIDTYVINAETGEIKEVQEESEINREAFIALVKEATKNEKKVTQRFFLLSAHRLFDLIEADKNRFALIHLKVFSTLLRAKGINNEPLNTAIKKIREQLQK